MQSVYIGLHFVQQGAWQALCALLSKILGINDTVCHTAIGRAGTSATAPTQENVELGFLSSNT